MTQTTVRPGRAAPRAAGRPLVGVLPDFKADLLGFLERTFARYGDCVAYRLGPSRPAWLGQTVVAAFHPDDVRRALTDPVFTRRTTGFSVAREMLGDGLLTLEGATWRRHRSIVQPLFSSRRVAGYAALMTEEAEQIAADPGVTSGDPVDLHDLMQRYTLRVVGRALFGDALGTVLPDLQLLVPQLGDVTTQRRMEMPPLPLAVPTPAHRRFQRVRRGLAGVVDRVLAERGPDPDPAADDLMTRLHAARDPETGAGLSRAEIRDEVLGFLLAGHETTAGALTFTLHELGRHPEIQDRVAAGGVPEEIARAAVQEGMRLYPPAHLTERSTGADTEIAGYAVPRNTMVLISPWVTHRHPAFWPDPLRFDPWRFVGTHDRPKYAYLPFGGGTRSCIGTHFALQEAAILLRALLTRHRVHTDDADLPVVPLLTLRPARPVTATLTPR